MIADDRENFLSKICDKCEGCEVSLIFLLVRNMNLGGIRERERGEK